MVKKSKKNRSLSVAFPVSLQVVRLRLVPLFFILLAVSMVFLHRVYDAPVVKMRVALTDFFAPVFSGISEPIQNATGRIDAVAGIRDLRAENMRLSEENRRLQQWYDVALRLEAENRSLKSLMNFKIEPDYSFITTRVVADPGGSFIKSVLIPVGRNDGVREGQAVMGEKGLIGRVVETGKNASRVLLVTDLNARAPVLIEGTRHKAILTGRNGDKMALQHLPLDSRPGLGARIVTSGDGGVLPPHLPIGTIVSRNGGMIEVSPLDDLDKLEYVRVIDFNADSALSTGHLKTKP
ncbi:MAG: rod shape-determining protein MreC [Pseudomonadota bacterium]|nr:rod shape-determining protein MreC [Pseudomonadota bacterium]QKK05741.1 MAG: rod shape-determining protein MreC [Pseudomonadota bacterium]